jgi:hypothetical protein
MTDEADVHLMADGKRIDAAEAHDGLYVFRLPCVPSSVAITSRDGVPSEMGVARDFRSLGIGLRQVVIRQGSRFKKIPADDRRLAEGFHAYEADSDMRWTNGMKDFVGAVEIVVTVAATAHYPDVGIGRRTAA